MGGADSLTLPSTGPARVRRRLNQAARPGAFTLIEILLVLALIAIISAVLLPATGAFLGRAEQPSPQEVTIKVFQEARQHAVISGRAVRLRIDANEDRFVLSSGSEVAHRPMGGEGFTVDFLRARDTAAVLIGGRLVETGTVDHIEFYPDGTCDPVRLQFRSQESEPRIVVIDPWTCAPGLEDAG